MSCSAALPIAWLSPSRFHSGFKTFGCLLLACMLVGAQLLLTLHTMEHMEHMEHQDDDRCEICLAGAPLGVAHLTSALDLGYSVNSTPRPLVAITRPPLQAIFNANRARAPPRAYRY